MAGQLQAATVTAGFSDRAATELHDRADNKNHDLLLYKLVQLTINSTSFDKTHSVKIDKIMSKPCSNQFVVPKG